MIEQHRDHQWQFGMSFIKMALHSSYGIAHQAKGHILIW